MKPLLKSFGQAMPLERIDFVDDKIGVLLLGNEGLEKRNLVHPNFRPLVRLVGRALKEAFRTQVQAIRSNEEIVQGAVKGCDGLVGKMIQIERLGHDSEWTSRNA